MVTLRSGSMKKMIASVALFAFFMIPAQGAFAWQYDGLNSLNPFTGFRNCNKCEKIKKQKCQKVKKDKCCAKRVHVIKKNCCTRAFND